MLIVINKKDNEFQISDKLHFCRKNHPFFNKNVIQAIKKSTKYFQGKCPVSNLLHNDLFSSFHEGF
jgi:hypothetical protein